MKTQPAVPIIPESTDQKTGAHKTSPIEANRWLIWIDTVELLTGRNLRRHDADLDLALTAYMAGESPVQYARSVAYPHATSTVLLWYTVIAIGLAGITAGVFAWWGAR